LYLRYAGAKSYWYGRTKSRAGEASGRPLQILKKGKDVEGQGTLWRPSALGKTGMWQGRIIKRRRQREANQKENHVSRDGTKVWPEYSKETAQQEKERAHWLDDSSKEEPAESENLSFH